MSATKQRMGLSYATGIAEAFVALIEPFCERVQIAGSIRRQRPEVGDIEIVAVPKLESVDALDMFGQTVSTETVDVLDLQLTMYLDKGRIEKRLDKNGRLRWGPKLKLLTFEGAPVDLFCTTAPQWGLILAIRTGPAAFSHQFVTPRGQSVVVGMDERGRPIKRMGRLPEHLKVDGGWLTSRVSGQRFDTYEERDFFNLARLDWREPEDRR